MGEAMQQAQTAMAQWSQRIQAGWSAIRETHAADRYEAQRAAYLRGGGARGTASRGRREAQLQRAALKRNRGGAGVDGAAVHVEIPKPSWKKWSHRPGGDSRGWLFKMLVVAVALVALPSVPGVVLGVATYLVLEAFWAAKFARRMMWIAYAAVTVAVVAYAVRWVTGGPRLGWRWDFHRLFATDGLVTYGIWTALIIAPATLAYLIYAWGWQGAPKPGPARPSKASDGSWKPVAESDRIAFDDRHRGPVYVPPVVETPTEAPPAKEPTPDYYGGGDSNNEDDERPTLAEQLGNEAPLPTTAPVAADEVGFDPTDDMNDNDNEEDLR